MGDTQQADATFHRPPRSWPDKVPAEELRIHAPPTRPEPPGGGQLLKRAGPPMYLVINKLPRKGGRLDIEMVSRAVPDARALITVAADAEAASALGAGEFSWERAPDSWSRSLRELATVMVADWAELGLAT